MDESSKHEHIPRYIQDRYREKDLGRLSDWFKCLSADGQRVRIQLAGKGGSFIDGEVGSAGHDHLVLYGDSDDIVLIPYSVIQFARIYNEELDEAVLAELQKEREAMESNFRRQREESKTAWELKHAEGIEEL